MVRALPIGVQDFKEIRESDYLYVDKSDMISQILSEGADVYLYTRPRRFGKSLNLSMLDAFFNLKYPKDNKWFDGLKVSDCKECMEYKNAYPVIYFDFKDLDANTYELFLKRLSIKISELFIQYEYLENSDKINRVQRSRFDSVYSGTTDESELMNALSLLMKMLYSYHGKKVIVLLDEYDNPIHNAYGKDFQKEIIGIMRGMLSSALKGNDSLMFGVITGVMQISKESIFSGLNNLEVNNIFSKDFDEMFGFTNGEVKSICEEYGHPEKYDEAKEWYRQIVADGHTLAMHSYSHKYSTIYESVDSFSADFTKLRDMLEDITGVNCRFYRFPGGSSNQVSNTDMNEFIDYLGEQGMTYYDWNVVCGDATSQIYTADELVQNVMTDVVKYKYSVVLMHDAAEKDSTVEALENILQKLEKMDAQILPITEDAPVIHHNLS